MSDCIHDFIQEMSVREICTQCGKTEVKILQEENAALWAENTVQWKTIKTLNVKLKDMTVASNALLVAAKLLLVELDDVHEFNGLPVPGCLVCEAAVRLQAQIEQIEEANNNG